MLRRKATNSFKKKQTRDFDLMKKYLNIKQLKETDFYHAFSEIKKEAYILPWKIFEGFFFKCFLPNFKIGSHLFTFSLFYFSKSFAKCARVILIIFLVLEVISILYFNQNLRIRKSCKFTRLRNNLKIIVSLLSVWLLSFLIKAINIGWIIRSKNRPSVYLDILSCHWSLLSPISNTKPVKILMSIIYPSMVRYNGI